MRLIIPLVVFGIVAAAQQAHVNLDFDLHVNKQNFKPFGAMLISPDVLPDKRVTFRTHTIARGQTLASVARQYGTKVSDIASANAIDASQSKRLARGTELIIPIPRASVPPPRRAPAAASETADITPERVRIQYKVKPGDTLTAIAARYRTTVHDLMSWNKLSGSQLAAGNLLTVYTRP